MGKVLMSGGGGSGIGSDDLTATLGDVIKGKSVIAKDTDDEIGTGTLELTGDAAVGDVLAGKGFYNTNPQSKQTGSMVDKSGTTQSATATLDATNKRVQLAIPATGKYDTAAKLYAAYSTLASLLGVEAAKMLTTETILGVTGTISPYHTNQSSKCGQNSYGVYFLFTPGYYYYENESPWVYRPLSDFGSVPLNKVLKGETFTSTAGLKVTGTMAVTSAILFSATALSATSIRISWTNPSSGPWEGVEIRMSTSSSPGVSGGTQKYKGRGTNGTVGGASNYVDLTGLTPGTTHYFTCTSYATGLGNGASYNVSAKTKGFLIYNYGTAIGTIEDGTIYDKLTINSDNLHVVTHKHDCSGYSQKRTMGAYNVIFDVEGKSTLNSLDSYTNVVIETKPIAYAYRADVVAYYSLAFKWNYWYEDDDEAGWEWTYWKVSGSGEALSLGSIQTLKIPIPVSQNYGQDKEDFKNTCTKHGYPDIITVGGNYHCYVDQEYAWGEYYLYRVYLE